MKRSHLKNSSTNPGRKTGLLLPLTLLLLSCIPNQDSGFRIYPYIQNPTQTGMSILWYTDGAGQGKVRCREVDSKIQQVKFSHPFLETALRYSTWEDTTFFDGQAPGAPYKHRIRFEGLKPGTRYEYTVEQGDSTFLSYFETAPLRNEKIRFIAYGDCETEPESRGKPARWSGPGSSVERHYLVDQSRGYQNNLDVIRSRNPDLVLITGDIVESGGEQRDWDEFWRHNTNSSPSLSLASSTPIAAIMGNHDYYGGPESGRYQQPESEFAIHKYLSYFEAPSNEALNKEQQARYYRMDYGPATFVFLDLCNNSPQGSDDDSNHFLLGENDEGGGDAPDFAPGSRQYEWLEEQLAEASEVSHFTIVVFHHAPYSSGPHGWPAGRGEGFDPQSGQPARLLTPLFMRYGVDLVLNGHDEMWERSEVEGIEIKADGTRHSHSIQFYDVGVGGDGLRAPIPGLDNPYQKFIAHEDSPEIWSDSVLVKGGKHYGHLEVDMQVGPDGKWQAVLKPVYVLPVFNSTTGSYSEYRRKLYDDQVILYETQ